MEKRQAQVGAFEKVTLYGLTIVAKRKVNYGPLDPKLSKEIFIRISGRRQFSGISQRSIARCFNNILSSSSWQTITG
jgi:hypothetical protein